MEKAATYTVMAPPHPCKRQWVVWAAVGVSVVALVVACVTAAVVNEQAGRINHLEGRLMETESHIENILRLTIANHEFDYQYYDDDDYLYDDDQVDGQEGITVRQVVRRRRQVNSNENELSDTPNVPIYDRSYGIDLKTHAAPKGLRLYDSLLDSETTEDQSGSEDTPETTESPIKPYHRTVVRQVDSTNGDAFGIPSGPAPLLRSRLTQRRSHTKSLHGSRRAPKRQQKQRARSDKSPESVVFRTSFVKATSRHDGYTSSNSVVSQGPESLEIPKVVEQNPERTAPAEFAHPPTSNLYGKKLKRRLRNKQHRRWRRTRPLITLAHFGASSVNTTSHGYHGAGEHLDWTPANWMDKLGLNSKYTLDEGTVTVKEPGLYYLYAQVLYESGRSGAGYQILVDDIPILECQLPALRPAPTCLTSGLSFLPRNAKVRVRDLMSNLVTVRRHQNTFFGLVKLMDARYTAEEMLLA
ncbi:uncharacterized protein LOC123512225 isoform X2 [Portunus trituberculatus]|uniref:uncharacterized protein LOC123512225 isoform X2 n=1 Tax=Portunus trituberculatus TaxID=210409 RepID=UPI001E1CBA03|nr:uncharacterized protein LOC123512225 isoform X2 [Portunus trituberculatus]